MQLLSILLLGQKDDMGERSRKLPNQIQNQALRKLQMLDYACHVNDLRVPPSNHLEALKGNRKGQHSIRINDQWRICFVCSHSSVHSSSNG